MTRHALIWFASWKVSLGTKLLVGCLMIWLLPALALFDAVSSLLGARARNRVLSAPLLRCPAGHTSETVGRFSCGNCSMVSDRHGLGPCPFCGSHSHLRCPCGLTIANPLAQDS